MLKKYLIKTFSFFLVFLILLSMVSCRSKDTQNTVVSYDGVVLNYYKLYDDPDFIEARISDFVKNYPGLKINYKVFNNYDEYSNLILNEMADGEGPDIFSMPNTWFASNSKKVRPMPQKYALPAEFSNTFVDVAYSDLVLNDSSGIPQIYGLPLYIDTLALYYNNSYFEDVLASQGKPSNTWEGIKSDVLALTKFDENTNEISVAGIAIGTSYNISRAVDILYLLFLQEGVSFYNENISLATFNSKTNAQKSLNALELFLSFNDPNQRYYTWDGYLADSTKNENEVDAFAKGNVAMIIGYSYTYSQILNKIKVLKSSGQLVIDPKVVKITYIPQMTDVSSKNSIRVTYANYFAETVSRNCKYSDIAWEFLAFMANKDNQIKYFSELKKPTSRRDLIDSQKNDPVYGVFVQQIGFAKSFPVIDSTKYNIIFKDLIFKSKNSLALQSLLNQAEKSVSLLLSPVGLLVPLNEKALNQTK